MHRTMAVVLFGLSLLIQSHVVSADATPYPARILNWCLSSNHVYHVVCGFTSATEACASVSNAGYVFDNFTMEHGYSGGSCWYRIPLYLPGSPLQNDFHWFRDTYCYKGGLQDDVSVAAPICSCRFFPPGYVYPPVFPNGDLSLCVPGVPDTCPVDPIPKFTPDPYPALIEELSPRMQTALSCLRAAIGGQGGSSIFKSGYRPAAYNAHIQAVFDQRAKLRNRGPECAARKAELAIEEERHDIGQERPGDNSLHITREAFDLGSSLSRDVTNGLAINCSAFAPIPLKDRNHFEHTR